MLAESLTMINSKNNKFDSVRGGLPTLTAEEINAASSYCDAIGLGMLKIRICGDDTEYDKTYDMLCNKVQRHATQWKAKNKEQKIKSLVKLAMFEHNKKPVCPACKGRKFNRFHKPCIPCKGKGEYIIRNSQRAKALDVAHTTWTRVWDDRYSQVMQIISEHESLAIRQLNKKLGRD